MSKDRGWRFWSWFFALAFVVPAAALAGIQAQGIQAQGIQAQGIQAQGIQAQGIQAQGIQAQGIQAQGIQAQGIQAQGIQAQGIQAQGVSLSGTDLLAADLKGVAIDHVDLRGTTATSAVERHELTSIPGLSTGHGNYISVRGGSAVGHYAIAHLIDVNRNAAEDLDLYIAAEQRDTVPNSFHRADEQDNQDELYVVFVFHEWSGQWTSLCPWNPLTGSASAMAIAEDSTQPNQFFFACTATGVASKCARNWGYRPWAEATDFTWNGTGWIEQRHPLDDLYRVCKFAAMADYCQNDFSFTKSGTLVDLFDSRQIVWPNSMANPWSAADDDSRWMFAQEFQVSYGMDKHQPQPTPAMRASSLQRTRYRELTPTGICADRFINVDRLEHDAFDDARWDDAPPGEPRVEVHSPTYCSHHENEQGIGLPWDCSPCTTAVCRDMPQCCAGAHLPQGWNKFCVDKAAEVCKDANGPFPPGKVWPTDLPANAPAPGKYLLGPGGAVLRVDGGGAEASPATVEGWACDPEWPGAVVSVEVWDKPRDKGGHRLGTVRAERPLALPLAKEVSAACDGVALEYADDARAAYKDHARHGFSFQLPAGQLGDVFVYAIDEATEDGPAAPPTLIRNGIVPVPGCGHGEHGPGGGLKAACSGCAAQVCGHGHHDCCAPGEGEWDEACVAAADGCLPAKSSEPGNARTQGVLTSGWIEAPTDGTYAFESPAEPSVLFINGQKVFDWWPTRGAAATPGTKSGTIALRGGIRYHLRWDRTPLEPGGAGSGLLWRAPGEREGRAIPADLLYQVAPGVGTGLRATYFPRPDFTGASKTRTDEVVDMGTRVVPPSPITVPDGFPTKGYSAVWEGEVVPFFTEDYTFIVVGSGQSELSVDGKGLAPLPTAVSSQPSPPSCPHDVCERGRQMTATAGATPACDSCVDVVCARDSYCCNGDFLSPFSTEPVWDGRCVAEAAELCHRTCAPVPNPVSPQRRTEAIHLQAGVHYPIRLSVSNDTFDNTVRLLWSSARQHLDVVPTYALYPVGERPRRSGAGLNVVMVVPGEDVKGKAMARKAKPAATVTPPPLIPIVAGAAPNAGGRDRAGQIGTPLVPVLAEKLDDHVARPAPPVPARPLRNEELLIDAAGPDDAEIALDGIGALTGGSIRAAVRGDAGDGGAPGPELGAAEATLTPDGHFQVVVKTGGFGKRVVELVQRTWAGGSCPKGTVCATSETFRLPVVVSQAGPPKIYTPRDPTVAPGPGPRVFIVTGVGARAPAKDDPRLTRKVEVAEDHSGAGATILEQRVSAAYDGTITGSVTLSSGDRDPAQGWHRLRFTLGKKVSAPVFVAVGIRPPIVTVPSSRRAVDCSPAAPDSRSLAVKGRLATPAFGRLVLAEETGRGDLTVLDAQARVEPQPQPDGTFPFQVDAKLPYGKHVVHVFQAPEPPPSLTPVERARFLRAFAIAEATPTTRLVLDVPPPPIETVANASLTLTALGPVHRLHLEAEGCSPPRPETPAGCGAGCNACAPAPVASTTAVEKKGCALPFANVSLRIGPRTFTTRADEYGFWSLEADVFRGWNEAVLLQTVGTSSGAGWIPSCPSNPVAVGIVTTAAAPPLNLPGEIKVPASSPAGADVRFEASTPGAALVSCTRASGATFPIGRTIVRCSAIDPATGGVALGQFTVEVVKADSKSPPASPPTAPTPPR